MEQDRFEHAIVPLIALKAQVRYLHGTGTGNKRALIEQ
jgi:hypothetical protein